MTIDALKSFRQKIAGCEIAVLMDLSTGTVLAWDSDLKWPQEELDDLCDLAARLLTTGPVFGPGQGRTRAILARETGCHIFQRVSPTGGEVFGCVLAPEAAMHGVFDALAPVLGDLPAGDPAALA